MAVGSFGTELRNFLVFHSLDSSDSFFGGGVDIFKCCQKVTLLRTKSFMHLFPLSRFLEKVMISRNRLKEVMNC